MCWPGRYEKTSSIHKYYLGARHSFPLLLILLVLSKNDPVLPLVLTTAPAHRVTVTCAATPRPQWSQHWPVPGVASRAQLCVDTQRDNM